MPFSHINGTPPPPLPEDSGLVDFLLGNGPSLIFVKDEDSKLIYANTAFLSIYAPDQRDSIIGTTTVESFPEDEAELFLSEDRRAFREGRSEIVEEITDWEAGRRTLLTRKVVFTNEHGQKRLVCIATDIT